MTNSLSPTAEREALIATIIRDVAELDNAPTDSGQMIVSPEELRVILERNLTPAAALLEPVGEGWVMVPKEPTDEMLTRAVYAIACGTAREVALKHYRAMIAASPKSKDQP